MGLIELFQIPSFSQVKQHWPPAFQAFPLLKLKSPGKHSQQYSFLGLCAHMSKYFIYEYTLGKKKKL